jgi:cytochrome d ubiquinol oxidase subunit II
MDLPLICAGVIAFGVLMYVVLDGFDLGLGVLFPWMPDEAARDIAIASIAPVWDGNETWLILGGVTLFAGFPAAYAIALPAFYIPVMLLLFSLIFRGVAFEFRAKAQASKRWWDAAFSIGSTLAAFAQGVLLGGLIEGVTVVDGAFAGGSWDFLSVFSVVSGFGVVGGYALLGSTWLVRKTVGPTHAWAKRTAGLALLISLGFIALVSIYTPLRFPQIAERWFGDHHWLPLTPVPLATAIVGFSVWRELRHGSDLAPFLYSIALFMLGFLGIAISLWPNLVPPSISIFNAAAPPSSQKFLLLQLAITLPMVMIYTGYAYWVFRGKVSANDGYSSH